MEKKKQMNVKTWRDVTLAQFEAINDIIASKSNTQELEIVRVLYGEDRGNIDFMNEQCPREKHHDKYWINGKQYRLSADITDLSMSQYIDAGNAQNTTELLACLLIPVSAHGYADGYDVRDVRQEIRDMSIVDVNAIAFFLSKQIALFVKIIQSSLKMNPMLEGKESPTMRIFLQNMEHLISSLMS